MENLIITIIGIISLILLLKLWGACNVINKIGDILLFEHEFLKSKFIEDVEKLHKEVTDPTEFRKRAHQLAEQYDEKQRIRSIDFFSMLNNFNW